MRKIVIITGLSGSGKTTAKDAFEDMGFYCIDNLPAGLLAEFLTLAERSVEDISKMAFVMDARAHDFFKLFPDVLTALKKTNYNLELLFLEASDEKLSRRFSETRRKHPLSLGGSAQAGIDKERTLLKDIKARATRVIDTSELNVHELKDILYKAFGQSTSTKGMNIKITSFGYRFGLPMDADIVFDVRFLPNPYFRDELKHKSGKERDVADYIMQAKDTKRFISKLKDMITFLVPMYQKEWKAYLNICVGCTGGKHRSVMIAEEINKLLSKKYGERVELIHRDILKS